MVFDDNYCIVFYELVLPNLNRGDMSYDDLEELLHSVRTFAAFSIEKKRPRRASSDLEL